MKATMGWPDRVLRRSEVKTRKIHRCWLCNDDIPVGEIAISIAAIDQQGGFTHGYHCVDEHCYENKTWNYYPV